MFEHTLSQDEVDALLKGVLGEVEDEYPQQGKRTIAPYDIGKQERIACAQMPMLDIINERFARLLRVELFNFVRRNAEISVSAVKVQKYSEFVRDLVAPANLNLVRFKPLRGTALFIFDPTLVFLIVDNLFGGDGRFNTRVEGRDFTPTEQRIIQRLLDVILEEYKKSWDPVYPIEFEVVRSEMNPQFAEVATPSEGVVVTTFNVELGEGGGDFHVCMPYAMIEPIRHFLTSSLQGERVEADKHWSRLMAQQVQDAQVELVTYLGESTLTLRQVMDMKVGDIIPLHIADTLTAKVSGVPVLECNYGEMNGQYAVKVKRVLNPAET